MQIQELIVTSLLKNHLTRIIETSVKPHETSNNFRRNMVELNERSNYYISIKCAKYLNTASQKSFDK